jgi:4-hydroxy-3-methylbut-2-en-1-yl diphosphate reductase
MEVLRITPRGYCHGVVDAFRIAKRVRESTQGPVHMLGQLVHNTHATDDLQAQGIKLVDPPNRLSGLDQISEGTVIFTAHGVSPQVKARAAEMGLKTVDATCSDVVRTHELVVRLAEQGYDVVYIGRKGHPEPEGVIGEAPGKVHLVQDFEDIDALQIDNPRVAVTCQTTLSVWDTEDLINRVRDRFPDAEVHNEICRATQERQEAAVEAAREVDLVIVVGSPRSSNSMRLVEVVKKLGGKPAHLVNDMEDIRTEWFDGVGRVGVTSGASTPSQLTRRVIEYIESLPDAAPADHVPTPFPDRRSRSPGGTSPGGGGLAPAEPSKDTAQA